MGKAHTFGTNRDWFASRFTPPLNTVFYVLSFFWHRVSPKLPWVKNIYFAVTKGRNRLVSRAGILGRLSFYGFEIVAEEDVKNRFFFIARKISAPSLDENPSYGPLVKLERHGFGGRPLTVYKFRTMYSYSEYLQKYIYTYNQLEKGGKFKNDFRVTGWGQFMRRTWLDELPMLYNWLKGDLQLLGVRPLSAQYLSLYPPEMKELRKQVKPGLLPPFYADMPKTFEDICESEKNYFKQYLNSPIKTQWIYFWKAVYNIMIRGARSK